MKDRVSIDLKDGVKDSKGVKKYIIDVGSQEDLARWKSALGDADGTTLGLALGVPVGLAVGDAVGANVGLAVSFVGYCVGSQFVGDFDGYPVKTL